jgi:Tfp pilus assembly protein PilO
MSIRMKSILERFSAYILIFILLIINLFLFINIRNDRKDLQRISSTIKQKETEEKNLSEKINDLEKRVEERSKRQEQTQKNITLFKNYFITRDDIPLIMKDVQKIGDESGVDIFSFDYQPLLENELKEFIKLEFSIKLSGDYPDVKKFFWKLEKIRWVLKQQDIEFIRLYDKERSSMNMELEIRLFTFVRKDVRTADKN